MICIYVHHIHVCVYIYNYIHPHIYIYVTGEILVKGWRLLSEECLSFRKNAAHFEDSRNLKQYRLHHVQGNSAFFSQKCCALLDIFLHTATRHSLTSKRHAFTNAHDMLRDYIKRICCTFSREETGLSWNNIYCIWQQTCMSKDWIWKVTLCFLSVWILYILKDSLKAGLYCTLVTELLPSLKVMLHFPGESVFFENGWRFFKLCA